MIFADEHNYLENHGGAERPLELYDFINYAKSSYRDTLRSHLDRYEQGTIMYCSDTQAVKETVLARLSISLLPESLVKHNIASGKLRRYF